MRFERLTQREDRRRLMTTTTRVPARKWSRIVLLSLGVNTMLWAVFWVGFFSESTAYPRLQIPSEGAYFSLVVAHRAASPDMYPNHDTCYQVSFLPNFPSFLMTRAAFNTVLRGYRSPELHFGTTVAGYELICWMIVSFLQWYLIGKMIGWLMRSKPHGVAAAAN
jgi:hypothetical protein